MPPAASHLHSTWNATLRTILGGALLVTLVLLAFVWPTATSKVHDLPIAVVGTGPEAQTVTDKLNSTGTFSVQTRESRDEAVDAIERRQVYGAVVVGSSPTDGGEVVTASAASPVVSQMMQGVSGQLSQAAGLTPPTWPAASTSWPSCARPRCASWWP